MPAIMVAEAHAVSFEHVMVTGPVPAMTVVKMQEEEPLQVMRQSPEPQARVAF